MDDRIDVGYMIVFGPDTDGHFEFIIDTDGFEEQSTYITTAEVRQLRDLLNVHLGESK